MISFSFQKIIRNGGFPVVENLSEISILSQKIDFFCQKLSPWCTRLQTENRAPLDEQIAFLGFRSCFSWYFVLLEVSKSIEDAPFSLAKITEQL